MGRNRRLCKKGAVKKVQNAKSKKNREKRRLIKKYGLKGRKNRSLCGFFFLLDAFC